MSVRTLLARWRPGQRGRVITPDLERFVQWLGATPYAWRVQADGRLRADDHGAVLCAVTAVARHREALAFSVGDWVHAGESLGLSYAAAGLIVDAADGRTRSRRLKMLRARLLAAARITPARSLPSEGFVVPRRLPNRRPARHAHPRHRSGHDLRTPTTTSASRG
jgi:hypothetical protein